MGRSSGRSDVRPVRGACVADRLDRRVWPRAYDVARRTRELGIRMALGATTGDIKRLVLRQGFKAAAVGLSLGLLLAVGIGRLVSSLLYRVSPLDPAALISAILVLGAATLLACYIPARRATRIAT